MRIESTPSGKPIDPPARTSARLKDFWVELERNDYDESDDSMTDAEIIQAIRRAMSPSDLAIYLSENDGTVHVGRSGTVGVSGATAREASIAFARQWLPNAENAERKAWSDYCERRDALDSLKKVIEEH
jgi:hypothetical protein